MSGEGCCRRLFCALIFPHDSFSTKNIAKTTLSLPVVMIDVEHLEEHIRGLWPYSPVPPLLPVYRVLALLRRKASFFYPLLFSSFSRPLFFGPLRAYCMTPFFKTHTPLSVDNRTQDSAAAAQENPADSAAVPTICRAPGCSNIPNGRNPFCWDHLTAARQCQHSGCDKLSQGNTRLCIAHGGGRRCTHPGCNKGARDRFFCAAHGGGKRCSTSACGKAAVGGSDLCTGHGGGKRCQVWGGGELRWGGGVQWDCFFRRGVGGPFLVVFVFLVGAGASVLMLSGEKKRICRRRFVCVDAVLSQSSFVVVVVMPYRSNPCFLIPLPPPPPSPIFPPLGIETNNERARGGNAISTRPARRVRSQRQTSV